MENGVFGDGEDGCDDVDRDDDHDKDDDDDDEGKRRRKTVLPLS